MPPPARHHHPRRRVRQGPKGLRFRFRVAAVVVAHRDDAEVDAGGVDVDERNLVRLLRLGLEHDELAVRRAPEPHREELVGFVVHEHVKGLRRAQHVAPHLVAPVRFVLRAVIHGHSFFLAPPLAAF